jgi:hypothetical protein
MDFDRFSLNSADFSEKSAGSEGANFLVSAGSLNTAPNHLPHLFISQSTPLFNIQCSSSFRKVFVKTERPPARFHFHPYSLSSPISELADLGHSAWRESELGSRVGGGE